MTTTTTNISFSGIQTEFGGSNPISLSEYYRGGTNVPTGTATSSTDGVAIAASGAIRAGMFRGVTKVVLWRPSAFSGGALNGANAYDSSTSTFASVTGTVILGGNANSNFAVFSGFSSSAPTSGTLKVTCRFSGVLMEPGVNSTNSASIVYSTNGGTSWVSLPGASVTNVTTATTTTTYSTTLASIDPTNLYVRADAGAELILDDSAMVDIFDITWE